VAQDIQFSGKITPFSDLSHSSTMFRLAVVGLAVADAGEYAKGFVRMPRNAAVPHATITEEMRAAAPASLDWTETTGAVSPVSKTRDSAPHVGHLQLLQPWRERGSGQQERC